MKHLLRAFLVCCTLWAAAATPYAANPRVKPDRPNVLLIIADDFRDTGGVFTKALVMTPNLDRLFWRNAKQGHAVREGNWKLVRLPDKPAELYDLSTDLAESKALAAAKPEVTARLNAALDAWDNEFIAPVFPGSGVKNEDWGPGGANQKDNPNGVKNPQRAQ